ncbi:MAG: formyltransferase family protein [Thaumarchaeota archaeon]|nr:formyltransferase family protein [Nitrososphaerota archaeon]
MEKKILVLASGRGTDFQALVDHEKLGILDGVKLEALVSNHDDSKVLQRAKEAGVRAVVIPGITGRNFETKEEREAMRVNFDQECAKLIWELGINLLVLAGFDQILGRKLVDSNIFKILNIHPAYDLVKFGGKNMVGRKVHEEVLKSGATYSGCTVHFVTNDLDLGPVILKKKTEIGPRETPESLERKILDLEHLAYPEAIQLVLDERVRVDTSGKACYVDRFSKNWDVEWDQRQRKYVEMIEGKLPV